MSILYLLIVLYVLALKQFSIVYKDWQYGIYIGGQAVLLIFAALFKQDDFTWYAKSGGLLIAFILVSELIQSQSKIAGQTFIGTTLGILTLLYAFTRPTLLGAISPNNSGIQKTIKVGTIDDTRNGFLAPPGSTFSCQFQISANRRTGGMGNSQKPIQLFKMGDVIKFQILPGGASAAPSTQLIIRTQKPSVDKNYETIMLKDIPRQQWVQVAIVREGRRFTVQYNGEIIASERTTYYPVIDSVALDIGDENLIGEQALPKIASVPLRRDEVQSDLAMTSDTRQKPQIPTSWLDAFSGIFSCPTGLFCMSVATAKPSDPTRVWKSPQA